MRHGQMPHSVASWAHYFGNNRRAKVLLFILWAKKLLHKMPKRDTKKAKFINFKHN